MHITIDYCVTCNYRPIAAVLGLNLQQAVGVKVDLVPSKRSGAFEVNADGDIIFSKLRSGSFPTAEQIIDILRKRMTA